jgi:DNA-directed RNA polymerase specialized sigma24 family protein
MSDQQVPSRVDADGSVTQWIDPLKTGDREAIGQLWRRYAQPLFDLARRRLSGSPKLVDRAEDLAVEAFLSFCRHAEAGDFKELADRRNVWGLLACITVRKTFGFRIKEGKRPDAVGELSGLGDRGFEGVASHEPEPEFVATIDSLLALLSPELREVAVLKMEGFTNQEIAGRRDCALRRVERQLALIRGRWRSHLKDT